MPHTEPPVRMDPTSLLAPWALPEPWNLAPLGRGTNNLVYQVETPAGRYILHVYTNHADPDRLAFEHAVLTALQAEALPFAVPTLIPTRAGAVFGRLAMPHGESLATLSPFIPGVPPGDHSAQAAAAGEALGILDTALVRLPSPGTGAGITWRSTGDLEHCHPLVPDPAWALAALPVAEDERRRLVARYAWLLERIPPLYATLPHQLCHEDYSLSNVLMQGAAVTGIVDFEFCARDVRVMDLAVALSWWPGDRFGTGQEWRLLRAFAQGYSLRVRLMPDEIAAVPALFELRAYSSLIHRLGRHRQGLSSLDAVVARAHAALDRDIWVREHGGRLIDTVQAASP